MNIIPITSAATVATEFNTFSKRIARGLMSAWDQLHGPGEYKALAAKMGRGNPDVRSLWSACSDAADLALEQGKPVDKDLLLAQVAAGAFLVLTDYRDPGDVEDEETGPALVRFIEERLDIAPGSDVWSGIATVLEGVCLAHAQVRAGESLADWLMDEGVVTSEIGDLNDLCEAALLSAGQPVWEFERAELQSIAMAHAAFNGLLNADHPVTVEYAEAGKELAAA